MQELSEKEQGKYREFKGQMKYQNVTDPDTLYAVSKVQKLHAKVAVIGCWAAIIVGFPMMVFIIGFVITGTGIGMLLYFKKRQKEWTKFVELYEKELQSVSAVPA